MNLTESNDSDSDTPVWWEPSIRREPEPRVLKKITGFNKLGKSDFLPAISVTNVCSLEPKFKNLSEFLKVFLKFFVVWLHKGFSEKI